MVKDAFSSVCMHLIHSSRIIVDEYISDLKDPGSYESIDEESTDEDIPDLEEEEEEDKKTN